MHWRIQGDTREICPNRGPKSLIFMQFLAKKLQNIRLAHPLWELAPPQENPGTATVMDCTNHAKWRAQNHQGVFWVFHLYASYVYWKMMACQNVTLVLFECETVWYSNNKEEMLHRKLICFESVPCPFNYTSSSWRQMSYFTSLRHNYSGSENVNILKS